MTRDCKTCGRPIKDWQRGDLCYSCKIQEYNKITSENLRSSEMTSTTCEDEIFCPWCGEIYNIDDEYELYGEGEHDLTCHHCDKEFSVETNVTYSFSTERKEADHAT